MPATVQQIVSGIQNLTNTNTEIIAALEKTTIVNVIFQGPATVGAMNKYCQQMSTEVLQPLYDNTPALTDDAQAKQIADVVRDFVGVAKKRNDLFVAKSGLYAKMFFGQPIAAGLRVMEGSGDTLMFMLVDYAPSQKAAIQEQAKIWSAGMNAAIAA
ncbi:hypothetical protein OC842_006232, partial [Tilletia horrida]